MHSYEVMVILDPQLDDRTVTPTIDKYLAAITTNGGTVDKVDIWGRRRMTYQIKKHSEGIYVVVNATSSPEAINEFDRQLRLSESVLRTKVLRLEDAVFSINPIEFVPDEKPARAPRGPRAGGKRPQGSRSN